MSGKIGCIQWELSDQRSFTFISAQDDAEFLCDFPPKSRITAALTALIDGQSGSGGFTGSPSLCCFPSLWPVPASVKQFKKCWMRNMETYPEALMKRGADDARRASSLHLGMDWLISSSQGRTKAVNHNQVRSIHLTVVSKHECF